MRRSYTLFVDNKPGILDRICGVIRRHGWNIKSMLITETDSPKVTRIAFDVEYSAFRELPDKKLAEMDFVRSVESKAEQE
jgi:acetolactate synthase small subunit